MPTPNGLSIGASLIVVPLVLLIAALVVGALIGAGTLESRSGEVPRRKIVSGSLGGLYGGLAGCVLATVFGDLTNWAGGFWGFIAVYAASVVGAAVAMCRPQE